MAGGPSVTLPVDIFDGQNGHAAKHNDANDQVNYLTSQVAGRLAPVDYRTGTGTPEGGVTAPVGTHYIDTAATAGAVEWIKASGTGNTGWKVLYGDTGWRDVSSLLKSGIAPSASGYARMRRVGSRVSVELRLNITTAGVTSLNASALPVGFRPALIAHRNGTAWTAAGTDQAITALTTPLSGYASGGDWGFVASPANPSSVAWTFDYLSNDTWPSILPGSAA